jgi:heme-degrading monooxygenase HmoA
MNPMRRVCLALLTLLAFSSPDLQAVARMRLPAASHEPRPFSSQALASPAVEFTRQHNRPSVIISVTRMSPRRLQDLPTFFKMFLEIFAQLEEAPGLLAWNVGIEESPTAFWTVTVWESRDAMLSFVRSGAHRKAISDLSIFVKEISAGHISWMNWSGERGKVTWLEVYDIMNLAGHPSVPDQRGLMLPNRTPKLLPAWPPLYLRNIRQSS